MSSDHLKLTIYFGESDRVDGQLLSDVLLDELEAAQVPAAVLLRATEGFGASPGLWLRGLGEHHCSRGRDRRLEAVGIEALERSIEAQARHLEQILERLS